MSILEKIGKCLIIIFISVSVLAQDEGRAEADFNADAYAERTEAHPDDAAAWFRLAVSSRQSERYSQARAALDEAEKREFSPIRIGLERARLDVLDGDTRAAISELQAVARGGFTGVSVISGDAVLARLAGQEDYETLLAEMSRQAFPCEHDPAFTTFDFWLGDWDVHAANGTYAGSNTIERAEHGCVLIEKWSSASGGTGTSINYLDGMSGEWVQVWNDAGGSQINIRGGMSEDGMRLSGTIHYLNNGTTAAFRGLWAPLPDGRVRQFFEQQSADGETWTPWFEGFYSRKAAE